MDAIVVSGVEKRFRKSTIRREYTTFKTELVRWLRGARRADQKATIDALRGVDLVVPRGKTVALIGRNGSGKSTLLKLITGIYKPTVGTVQVNGRISSLLELGAGFHPDFSGRENILINGIILGMTRAEIRARTDDIIAFSELGDFVDEPVRTYSSGMYMRLAFAVATHVDPDILLVDEVLAVGDEHFSKKSLAKMMEFKKAGKTIVLVTHDLGTVERWCDLCAWVDGGRIRRLGPPHEVVAEYRRAVALAESQHADFTPSALSATGGALPEVEAPEPSGPGLQLERLGVLGPDGAPREALAPGETATVSVTLRAGAAVQDVGLEVALTREDGKLCLFRSASRGRAAPLALGAGEAREVRLEVGVSGLAPGSYALEVAAEIGGVRVRGAEAHGGVRVQGEADVADGLLRLPHVWRLEAAPRVGSAADR